MSGQELGFEKDIREINQKLNAVIYELRRISEWLYELRNEVQYGLKLELVESKDLHHRLLEAAKEMLKQKKTTRSKRRKRAKRKKKKK